MAKPRPFELDDLAEALNNLECRVCLEIFIPPIYVCPAGHSICWGCRSNVKDCPTCRKAFADTRNFSLEKVFNKANVQCKYVEQGCKKILKGEEHKPHVVSCYYRPVDCSMCDKKQIDFAIFVQHINDVHKELERTKLDSEGSISIENTLSESSVKPDHCSTWSCFWFKHQNSLMFVQPEFRKGYLFFSVREWSPEPQDWKCEIKLQLRNEFVGIWKVNVTSFRKTVGEVFESGQVGMIPYQTILYNNKTTFGKYSLQYSYKIL